MSEDKNIQIADTIPLCYNKWKTVSVL